MFGAKYRVCKSSHIVNAEEIQDRERKSACQVQHEAELAHKDQLKILDKLVDLTKKKGDCNFQETLFRTRMHMYKDNNGVLGNIKKETETGEDKGGYKALFVIQ